MPWFTVKSWWTDQTQQGGGGGSGAEVAEAQAKGQAAGLAESSGAEGQDAWAALMEARDSGTLEANRGMRTMSAKTGIDSLTVDRESATLTIKYRSGSSKSLPAAVQESENFRPGVGSVRRTVWNPVSGKYENTRIPWNVDNDNPYGPAIILVDGTGHRHIHGTNGPMDGGMPYIGGSDPVGRQITHGCGRITNDQIILLKPQVDATLRGGYTIGVVFR